MMGGRGRDSGLIGRQISIEEVQMRNRVTGIIKENESLRTNIMAIGGGGGGKSILLLKKCACCGEYTIPINTELVECPNCGWIDDSYQNKHKDSLFGKNPQTLNQARKLYFEKSSNNE